MKKLCIILAFISLPCYCATIKATGHVVCKIVVPFEVPSVQTINPVEIEQAVVYTENGPTLQIIF